MAGMGGEVDKVGVVDQFDVSIGPGEVIRKYPLSILMFYTCSTDILESLLHVLMTT